MSKLARFETRSHEMLMIAMVRFLVIGISLFAVALCYASGVQRAGTDSDRPSLRLDEDTVRSDDVFEAEQLLRSLGYWAGPTDGEMDEASRQALIAFQKVEHRDATGQLTTTEIRALRKAHRPSARFKGDFHVEIDLKRQVLFVVEHNVVKLTLPVSTGAGQLFTEGGWTRYAKTPRGTFRVYKKLLDWRKTPLGMLYYPSYIIGGVAIHGSRVVPTYPATHGCIAVPMHAAEQLSEITPVGTKVIVYGRR